jgi:protein-S-isoprenylcysteine O-methyltransferase Ste14
MNKLFLFFLLSLPIVALSWKTLSNQKSHGFYRFFAWECILWLFVQNYTYWFSNPLTLYHIISWILLIIAGYVVIAGVIKLKKSGNSGNSRTDKHLYNFEKTTKLVDTGIYQYIRHPLYASLIFLAWGIFFKNPRFQLVIFSAMATVLLYFTARMDEQECSEFFGIDYKEYMKRSKMFIPYIF